MLTSLKRLTKRGRQAHWAEVQSKKLPTEINRLATEVRKLDGREGIDTNSHPDKVAFSKQYFETDYALGYFSGQAQYADGVVQSLEMTNEDGQKLSFSQREEEKIWSAELKNLAFKVRTKPDSDDITIEESRRVDPTTTGHKIERAWEGVSRALSDAALSSIPVFGLGFTGLANMFNDDPRDTVTQVGSLLGNVIGTGLLLAGATTAGVVGLAVAGTCAGIQALRGFGLSSRSTRPRLEITSWYVPKEN